MISWLLDDKGHESMVRVVSFRPLRQYHFHFFNICIAASAMPRWPPSSQMQAPNCRSLQGTLRRLHPGWPIPTQATPLQPDTGLVLRAMVARAQSRGLGWASWRGHSHTVSHCHSLGTVAAAAAAAAAAASGKTGGATGAGLRDCTCVRSAPNRDCKKVGTLISMDCRRFVHFFWASAKVPASQGQEIHKKSTTWRDPMKDRTRWSS